MRRALKLLLACGLGAVLLSSPAASAETARPEPFAFNWVGAPGSPQPWNPADWDVVVHSRDINTWGQIEPISAGHGPDCSPPPATHPVATYEDSVYICKNHMMTAINAGGYGAIYFAPNRLVDFSSGTASVRYRVSTHRDSLRDWHDIWITPFDDNLVLPLYRFPDLQGPPRNAVHIQLVGDNTFIGHVLRNFVSTDLPKVNGTPYDALFGPSPTQRSAFELDISRTHIRFGMPEYNLWWIDTDVPDLGFTQGVVQLGHHSYNPTKADKGFPGTWHWSEFSISSAVPFTMLRGDIQSINSNTNSGVCFPAPATSESHLRFAGVGTIQVSFDGGRNFVAPQPAAQIGPHNEGSPQVGLFTSYWTPIPQGTRSVVFRGTEWWGGPWWVRDPAIWSRSTEQPVTPTSVCQRPTWKAVSPAAPAAHSAGRASNDSSVVAFLQESELLAGMRMAGRKNLTLLGLCFVIALGVAVAVGFGLGRRRNRARGPNQHP
jgi:hypothetical protein